MHGQGIVEKEGVIHIFHTRHRICQKQRLLFGNRLARGKTARFADDDIGRIHVFIHVVHKAKDMHGIAEADPLEFFLQHLV